MTQKKSFLIFITTFLLLCIAFGAVTVYVDPFFHYHAPTDGLAYPLNNERYQNDGISRYFSYDAVITGTSITEPFSKSAVDAAFGVNSIKICYSGAGYKELDEALKKCLERQPDVKLVIRGLDYYMLTLDKDYAKYEETPDYLYNENPFDDVKYILNKEVFFFRSLGVLDYTRNGGVTTSFDAYALSDGPFGREAVLSYVDRREDISAKKHKQSKKKKERERQNIRQNLSRTIEAYPDVTFVYFLSPYSVLYWDKLYRDGNIRKHISEERVLIEELIGYDNVKLFSFALAPEIVADLDSYRDTSHNNPEKCRLMTEYMASDQYRITKDNYKKYLKELKKTYENYDYDSIYGE